MSLVLEYFRIVFDMIGVTENSGWISCEKTFSKSHPLEKTDVIFHKAVNFSSINSSYNNLLSRSYSM